MYGYTALCLAGRGIADMLILGGGTATGYLMLLDVTLCPKIAPFEMVKVVSRDSNPRTHQDSNGQSSNCSGLRYSEWTGSDVEGLRIAPILPQFCPKNNEERDMTEAQLLARRADHSTSHLLHLVLSVITVGFWVPVWILITMSHAVERGRIDRKLGKEE